MDADLEVSRKVLFHVSDGEVAFAELLKGMNGSAPLLTVNSRFA